MVKLMLLIPYGHYWQWKHGLKIFWIKSFMKRKVFFVAFNITFILILIKALPAQFKVNVRFALFSSYTQNLSDFEYNPTELKNGALDFVYFKEKYIKNILETHAIAPFAFADSINYRDRVKKIALTYSKNGGPGCGANSDDLVKNIKWLSEDNGHGCCSDHSQAFIALCLINNIFAREVHHKSHTFNEFFDPQLQKWVWIDTQYCLMAQNEIGQYLSLKEIFLYSKENKKIEWAFFGTPLHKLYNTSDYKRITNYFTPQEFSLILMTLGNNVFEVDYYNQKYAWVSQELRQFLLLSIHKQPSYLFYDPQNLLVSKLKKIQITFWSIILFFGGINLWILFPSMKYRFKRKILRKN
jgi:hypothetical protein